MCNSLLLGQGFRPKAGQYGKVMNMKQIIECFLFYFHSRERKSKCIIIMFIKFSTLIKKLMTFGSVVQSWLGLLWPHSEKNNVYVLTCNITFFCMFTFVEIKLNALLFWLLFYFFKLLNSLPMEQGFGFFYLERRVVVINICHILNKYFVRSFVTLGLPIVAGLWSLSDHQCMWASYI